MGAAALVLALSGCILSETGGARYVADESATLEGRLFSSETGERDVWFEYGTTIAYGQSTDHVTYQVSEDSWRPVAIGVVGLEMGTTYHYRLCATRAPGADARCGEDRTVATGVGRRSVKGDATYGLGVGLPSASVNAVVDPGHLGYLDGYVSYSDSVQTPTHPPVGWGGAGEPGCLRIEGNVAAVGFAWNDEILGFVEAVLVIEDNGPSGDRFALRLDESSTSCPEPDASLIWAGTGPVVEGDFVVDGS